MSAYNGHSFAFDRAFGRRPARCCSPQMLQKLKTHSVADYVASARYVANSSTGMRIYSSPTADAKLNDC